MQLRLCLRLKGSPVSEFSLYLIGSFFAPLYAILLTDYFILKRTKIRKTLRLDWISTFTWIIGILIYRKFVQFDMFLGATVPSMFVISMLFLIIHLVINKFVIKQVVGNKNVSS